MWIYSENDCGSGTLCGSTPEGLSWLLQRRVELKQSKDASDHLTHARAADQARWITVNTDRNKYVQGRKSGILDFPEKEKTKGQHRICLVGVIISSLSVCVCVCIHIEAKLAPLRLREVTKPTKGAGARFVHRKTIKNRLLFLKKKSKKKEGNFTLYITITITNKIIIIIPKQKIMFFFSSDRPEAECFLEMGLDVEKSLVGSFGEGLAWSLLVRPPPPPG